MTGQRKVLVIKNPMMGKDSQKNPGFFSCM